MSVKVGKVSAKEFDDLSRPFSLDLVAVFNLMKEDVLDMVYKAEKEGWSEEELVDKIRGII